MTNSRYPLNQELPEDSSLSDEKERLLERVEGYEALGMHKEAIDACKSLVSLDPDDPASVVELGVQYDLKGETGEAVKNFVYGIKKFPGYFRTYVALGYWFEKYRKRRDMAMLCYEKALELNPNDEWALYNMAWLLHCLGKWQEAIAYYEESYEECKQKGLEFGRNLHGLGWSYYYLRNYKKAWVMFDRIFKEQPDYAEEKNEMWADFACVNYRLGRYGMALSLLEEALARQPDRKRFSRLHKLVSEKVSLFTIKHTKRHFPQ